MELVYQEYAKTHEQGHMIVDLWQTTMARHNITGRVVWYHNSTSGWCCVAVYVQPQFVNEMTSIVRSFNGVFIEA